MTLKSNFSQTEIKTKMERYCIYQERCHQEVRQKMFEMKLSRETKEKVLLHLLENDYLNETRFAQTFARGKFRIKKWGKQRIVNELKQRQISEINIKIALKEIDETEYFNTFNELTLHRLSQITEKDKYKKRKKLADYLLYRGWESNLVYEKVVALIP